MSRWISAIVIGLFCCSVALSQVGKDTGYWTFVPPSEETDSLRSSIVTVACADGVATGFVVEYAGERYVLTAAHVVFIAEPISGQLTEAASKDIRVCFRGGFIDQAKVIGHDIEVDVCVLECEIPEHVASLKISMSQPQHGDELQIIGLGGLTLFHAPIRHWKTCAAWGTGDTTIADCGVIPGDSGGAILNESCEVVGIVSGGWRWIHEKRFIDGERPISVTWPCIGPGAFQIRRVLAEMK